MLAEIIEHKRRELEQRRADRPLPEVTAACADMPPARNFADPLRRSAGPLKLLAEVKRGSPSKGVINPDVSVAETARTYAGCGAAAISVLTDEHYFMGSDAHVAEIKAACDLPVLRKDFTLDEYHVFEARSIGADAVLLMAQVLSRDELTDLLALTQYLGMEALVECHEPAEMENVLAAGATVVGVNNRDLWTLEMDMETVFRLLPLVPDDKVLVSQSGVAERAHAKRIEATRVDAIQVGTSIMASGDAAAKIRELMGG